MVLTQVIGIFGLSLATAMGVGPLPARAQVGSLLGRVTDLRGTPLGGVDVSVVGLRTTTSDSGLFRFNLPAGTHSISFRRVGYAPVLDSIVVTDESIINRQFVLVSPVTSLEPVVVVRPLSPAMRRFEDRKRTQHGTFITYESLKQDQAKPLRSVLARKLPGVSFVTYRGAMYATSRRGNSEIDPRMRIRAIPNDLRSPQACYVQVFLDGSRMYAPDGSSNALDVNDFQTRDFEAIEFYSGSANTPPEFSSPWAQCGTLVFWTRLP
jgi:hypothetical protein